MQPLPQAPSSPLPPGLSEPLESSWPSPQPLSRQIRTRSLLVRDSHGLCLSEPQGFVREVGTATVAPASHTVVVVGIHQGATRESHVNSTRGCELDSGLAAQQAEETVGAKTGGGWRR